jgi:formate dehydrogenase maturation protein FdhE
VEVLLVFQAPLAQPQQLLVQKVRLFLTCDTATLQQLRYNTRQPLNHQQYPAISVLIRFQQPTTNNQQPTTNNQQPTTNNQQPTTNYQQ